MSEGGAKFVEEEGVGDCLPALMRGRAHPRKVGEGEQKSALSKIVNFVIMYMVFRGREITDPVIHF